MRPTAIRYALGFQGRRVRAQTAWPQKDTVDPPVPRYEHLQRGTIKTRACLLCLQGPTHRTSNAASTDAQTQVYVYFEQKRNTWNDQHPHSPMTLTNSAIDHIRPVDAFQKGCLLEKTTLCNSLSNLQPLLRSEDCRHVHVIELGQTRLDQSAQLACASSPHYLLVDINASLY